VTAKAAIERQKMVPGENLGNKIGAPSLSKGYEVRSVAITSLQPKLVHSRHRSHITISNKWHRLEL